MAINPEPSPHKDNPVTWDTVIDDAVSARANRSWWDSDAEDYHLEHDSYLSSFYWCPEMLHESTAQLLGNITQQRVLEIGCGSAPCATWLAAEYPHATVVGFDLSRRMLKLAATPASPSQGPLLVQADAASLPFRDAAFDQAFSVFGAIPFIADLDNCLNEIRRVLVPGGRFVYAVTHPMRWIFPDDPGPEGLLASTSYFDRSAYVERDHTGAATYVEHHRTLGDHIRALRSTGFILEDLIEPEWPEGLTETWGQWSPLRGSIFPGTAIFVATAPPRSSAAG